MPRISRPNDGDHPQNPTLPTTLPTDLEKELKDNSLFGVNLS